MNKINKEYYVLDFIQVPEANTNDLITYIRRIDNTNEQLLFRTGMDEIQKILNQQYSGRLPTKLGENKNKNLINPKSLSKIREIQKEIELGEFAGLYRARKDFSELPRLGQNYSNVPEGWVELNLQNNPRFGNTNLSKIIEKSFWNLPNLEANDTTAIIPEYLAQRA
ncbi:MAG: hypothetical protein KC550_01790 [Nanoarchaeota archaeon]|nr:hypothetical protein [Nanoarchaeota archaeon]